MRQRDDGMIISTAAHVRNKNWRVLRAYTAPTAITNWKTLFRLMNKMKEGTELIPLTGQVQRCSDTLAFLKRQLRQQYSGIHHWLAWFVVPSKTARPRWQGLRRSLLGLSQHRNGKQWTRAESSKASEKCKQNGKTIALTLCQKLAMSTSGWETTGGYSHDVSSECFEENLVKGIESPPWRLEVVGEAIVNVWCQEFVAYGSPFPSIKVSDEPLNSSDSFGWRWGWRRCWRVSAG